ncbi:MAG: MFS transporter, partial [Anaerolineaceae bacterium]|nr:MFS transporter [Anaerolineaceae bacterium]
FYVKELGASDAWLGILLAFNSAANIIGFGLWRKVIQKYGRKKILMFTSLLRPIYPIVVALSQNLPAIIVVSAVTGLLMPGLNLSHYNLLLTITPGDRRDEFTAYYTTFQNVSVFLSPLLGALIILWVGYPITFLIFAGVRLFGGLMWRFLPIKDFDRQPAKTV